LRLPYATLLVLGGVTIVTLLQFVFPGLLPALARRPGEAADGEWWRLATALFVHDQGLPQLALNLVAGSIGGVAAERLYGTWRWLVFFFAAGLFGNLAGLAWQPSGAGCSVAVAGLFGAVFAWLLCRPGLPLQARGGAILGLAGAVALIAVRDIHGPPVILGFVLALFLHPPNFALPGGRRGGNPSLHFIVSKGGGHPR
jgi:rhomboid protease GluP